MLNGLLEPKIVERTLGSCGWLANLVPSVPATFGWKNLLSVKKSFIPVIPRCIKLGWGIWLCTCLSYSAKFSYLACSAGFCK